MLGLQTGAVHPGDWATSAGGRSANHVGEPCRVHGTCASSHRNQQLSCSVVLEIATRSASAGHRWGLYLSSTRSRVGRRGLGDTVGPPGCLSHGVAGGARSTRVTDTRVVSFMRVNFALTTTHQYSIEGAVSQAFLRVFHAGSISKTTRHRGGDSQLCPTDPSPRQACWGPDTTRSTPVF